jgi:hypothetical protein
MRTELSTENVGLTKNVYAIYDSKGEIYMDPVLGMNNATVLRSLQAAVNDPNHDFHKFAEDFTLFHIGTWNDKKGEYSMFKTKINLGGLWELKAQAQAPRVARGPAPDLAEPIRQVTQ